MKKCESHLDFPKRSIRMTSWALLALLSAQVAHGRVPATPPELPGPETNGLVPATSQPPLVPADVPVPQPNQRTAAPNDSIAPAPEAPGVPPISPVRPPQVVTPPAPPDEPGRALRIGMSLLIGGGAGLVGGLGGGLLGAAAIRNETVQPVGNVWTGAALGFCVAAPLGVILAGWLFDGDGAWWAAVLGDLAGFAAGAAATLFGGIEGLPLLFVFPLAGSVLGYESSSSPSRSHARLTPVATMGPGGGSIGLGGRF